MKRAISILVIALTVALLMQTVGLAWMSDNGLSSIINLSGSVHKNYFEYGNGSKENPYGIANPVQLYYFSWLQYLGYFNLDKNKDNVIDTTYYFEIDPSLEGDLDMTGFKLPPIGTVDNPFIGNFNGNGKTISNLTVKNDYGTLSAPPSGSESFGGAEIIGFFGVIGSLPETPYTYTTAANEVKNLALEGLTIETQTDTALIGIVAGYVNGTVDCVGVVGGTVRIKNAPGALTYTENLSDYALIGHCTEPFRDSIYVTDAMLHAPALSAPYTVVPEAGGGDAQGWGGSIAMDKMFTFVQDMKNSATENKSYVYDKTYIIYPNGTKNLIASKTAGKKVIYDENLGASFVFSPTGNDNPSSTYSSQYTYLSGGATVTNHTYSYTNDDVDVYYITDGSNNYLTFNGTTISNTTNRADATKWYMSSGASGGNIYTVVNGRPYALTVTNRTLSTALTPDINSTWSVSDNLLRCNSYYLYHNGTKWTVSSSLPQKASQTTISSGENYLGANGTAIQNTDETNAPTWTFTPKDGGYTISTKIGNTTRYLGYTRSGYTYSLSLNTTPTTWQYSSTNKRLYISIYGQQRYLNYSNGWTLGTNSAELTLDLGYKSSAEASGSREKELAYTTTYGMENEITKSGNSIQTGVTYYPITVEKSGDTYTATAAGNTGYVISSSQSKTVSSSHTYPNASGDIRVSRYTTDDSIPNYTTPKTITYKTNGAYKTIENSSDATTYGLEKFNDCFTRYTDSVSEDGNNDRKADCYGLHFMEATINIENIVTADKVQIIGETYSDYQLPTNCIDFHLAEQGFINFVAGTYFTDNNSFFSLHKIERSEDQKTITAIKEILSIYGYVDKNGNLDVNAPYYYTYTDGSADPNRPDDYSVVFDAEWITSPKGLTEKTAYYFEVPVYAGEYALGSAGEDKIGAYLVYLDLAANAQIIERTKEYEEICEETSGGNIPDGVELLDPADKTNGTYNTSDIDPMGSAFITITPDASGEITFNRVGDTVTHSAKDGTAAEFIGADLILKDGNGNTVTMPSVKTKIERTTYRDYNINTRVSTVTVITKTTVTEGQTETVTYTKQTTATDADGNVIADKSYDAKEVSAKDAVPDTKATGEGDDQILTAGSKLIDLAFAYGQGDNVTIAYLYTPAVKDESNAVTAPATYLITITNKGEKDINVKAILTTDATTSGITFIISDGTTQTTLDNATDAQTVTIKSAGTAEGA